jgi:branched-chain amino acid transport system permease protein
MGVSPSLAQLDATTLPLQVVPALGAVLFARFTSFGITTVVGLAIGVVQSLLYYASTQSWFLTRQGRRASRISSPLTFILIVIAPLRARLEPADAASSSSSASPAVPRPGAPRLVRALGGASRP